MTNEVENKSMGVAVQLKNDLVGHKVDAVLFEEIKKAKSLVITDITDTEGYKKVSEARKKAKNTRILIEKIVKAGVDGVKVQIEEWKTEGNKYLEPISEVEGILSTREKAHEEKIAKAKALTEAMAKMPARKMRLEEANMEMLDTEIMALSDSDFDRKINTKIAEDLRKQKAELDAKARELAELDAKARELAEQEKARTNAGPAIDPNNLPIGLEISPTGEFRHTGQGDMFAKKFEPVDYDMATFTAIKDQLKNESNWSFSGLKTDKGKKLNAEVATLRAKIVAYIDSEIAKW